MQYFNYSLTYNGNQTTDTFIQIRNQKNKVSKNKLNGVVRIFLFYRGTNVSRKQNLLRITIYIYIYIM